MKKLFTMLMVMSIITVGFSKPLKIKEEKKESHLTIKGESLTSGDYTYEVMIRVGQEYATISKEWSYFGHYRIKVDAEFDYKVVFTDERGNHKVMYINKTDPNGEDYKYKIDVDFRFEAYFAELKKIGKKYKHSVHTF